MRCLTCSLTTNLIRQRAEGTSLQHLHKLRFNNRYFTLIHNTPYGRSSLALYAKDVKDRDSVVKYYLTTASDGKEYNVEYFSSR